MKRTLVLAVFALAFNPFSIAQGFAAQAHWRRIDLGSSSLTLNGIDPVFGSFGEIHMQSGDYAFYDPASGIQIVAPAGAVTAVSAQAFAGSYSNTTDVNISGFQWWPKSNQFFAFVWGATATFVTGQLADGTVEGWYDDYHFNDISFVATPVLDSSGKVLYYNSETYAVPNSTSTQILIANDFGRAGTFLAADGSWDGFVERNGTLHALHLPHASISITALSRDCMAGFTLGVNGNQQAFLSCEGSPASVPVRVGFGTVVKQILPSGNLVGYAQDDSGGNFGFVWWRDGQ
jgi:hypothetical protein